MCKNNHLSQSPGPPPNKRVKFPTPSFMPSLHSCSYRSANDLRIRSGDPCATNPLTLLYVT